MPVNVNTKFAELPSQTVVGNAIVAVGRGVTVTVADPVNSSAFAAQLFAEPSVKAVSE